MSEKLRRGTDLRIAEKVFKEFRKQFDGPMYASDFTFWLDGELDKISKGVEHGDKLTAVPSG